jgi:hypothetical protein
MKNMDPCVYPGTDVLRNLRNIRDPAQLNTAEAIVTTRRIRELEGQSRLPGNSIPLVSNPFNVTFFGSAREFEEPPIAGDLSVLPSWDW